MTAVFGTRLFEVELAAHSAALQLAQNKGVQEAKEVPSTQDHFAQVSYSPLDYRPRYEDMLLREPTTVWLLDAVRETPLSPEAEGQEKKIRKDRNSTRSDLDSHFARIKQHLLDSPDTLSDHEILELALHSVLKKRDTRSIARKLLLKYQTLGAVVAAALPELLSIPDLDQIGAVTLKLMHVSNISVLRKEVQNLPVLASCNQLSDYLSVKLQHERVEHFHLLYLNNAYKLLADEILARGTLDFVPIFPREIIKRCLELHASAIIMVHNHPSGNPQASQKDIQMTKEVEVAGAMMGIILVDHIIVSRSGCRSFRSEKHL